MLKKKYYYPTDKYFFITVYPNSSSFGSTIPNGTDKYLKDSSLSISATPNTGYIFSRWSDNDTNASRTVTVVEDKTYTAIFTLSNYTVTYNGNGNTGGNVPIDPDSPYSSGSEVEVLGNTGSLIKTGYIFGGWNTQADGQGNHYNPGDTFNISENTTLYAEWAVYTVTVISTDRCSIAIDGVTDGYKGCLVGANVSGITTTPATNYQVVGYTIQPEHGTSYRVDTGINIVMPSDNITITPISQVVKSSRKLTMLGYGSDCEQVAVYDQTTQQITTTYISARNFTAYNNLRCEWSRAAIVNHGSPVECKIDRPFLYAESNQWTTSRVGTGNYGDTVYFVFGLSEQESMYEPYGFEVYETIDDTQTQKTVIVGTQASIVGIQNGDGQNTTNAVCGSITLQYPTNIRCLVIPKSST